MGDERIKTQFLSHPKAFIALIWEEDLHQRLYLGFQAEYLREAWVVQKKDSTALSCKG